jgi:hypothetical protein
VPGHDRNKNLSIICNITNITLIYVTLDALGIMHGHAWARLSQESHCYFVTLSWMSLH